MAKHRYHEGFEAGGLLVERFGRFMRMRNVRSPAQHREAMRRAAEFHKHAPELIAKQATELEGILDRYDPLDVMAHISFILGLPGETPETLKETVDFGERLKALGAYHGFHLLAPFPGTEVRQESDKYGIKILTHDWTQYHANRAIVETSSVSQKMLNDTVMEWEKECDEWLAAMIANTEKGEATEEEAFQVNRLEETVLIYDLMMGRVLEEKGFWSTNKSVSFSENLKSLVKRVASSTHYSEDQILSALNSSWKKENLRYTEGDGQIRWEWVDLLQS